MHIHGHAPGVTRHFKYRHTLSAPTTPAMRSSIKLAVSSCSTERGYPSPSPCSCAFAPGPAACRVLAIAALTALISDRSSGCKGGPASAQHERQSRQTSAWKRDPWEGAKPEHRKLGCACPNEKEIRIHHTGAHERNKHEQGGKCRKV